MIRILYLSGQYLFYATLIGSFTACEKKEREDHKTLFHNVPPSESNINFENTLIDTDDFNIIEYLYFYNGGGVAAGDINNDGLADIYFTSNQESNKLFLNKGHLQFEDITVKAGVSGFGNWKTGVTMADVNADGLLDIFICGVGNYKKFTGQNQLLINNGNLTFTDKTEEYGLSFQGFSTQTSFFDYDNDGDLDMYLLNHSVHTTRSYGDVTLRYQNDPLAGDKLYRNELAQTGQTHFVDVTMQAGILSSHIGYGLGLAVSDLNNDGFLDIYVSNDFNENDYLYVNQGDGTFKQELEKSLAHSSRFSMGNDAADINNDGRIDILTLDMMPKQEEIIKTSAGEDAFEIQQFKLSYGYHYQVARNALQLNRGGFPNGDMIFTDIAPFAGIEATDWSWAPLLADFDNDGFKDAFIANGIVKRPNDLDYINFISNDSAQRYSTDEEFIKKMPSGKVPNVFYHNQHNLTFKDASKEWIGNEPSLSNGSAYADLDNDGDLDLIVNTINEQAIIYRNDLPKESSRFIKFKLEGDELNRFGIGARIMVYCGQKSIYQEQMPSRGWLSSSDYVMNIGLGALEKKTDSVTIIWPGGKFQTLTSLLLNQTVTVHQKDALKEWKYKPRVVSASIFEEVSTIHIDHEENDFVPFGTERLIPHMLSTQGPRMSLGDINDDKLNDVFIGGASGQSGRIFKQGRNGDLTMTSQVSIASDSLAEDVASAFFDADGNGTLDLVVVGGGQEFSGQDKNLKPRLYLNSGKGNFVKSEQSMPEIFVNASCVKPADIDRDGDIDLFIGGRVVAGQYGVDPSSFVLINNGKGVFSDETNRFFAAANNGLLGMITDAIWLDLNKDKRLDLVVVGEWMPITVFLQNESGVFQDNTEQFNLKKTNGWWNTITSRDFDEDGDLDMIVGNLGLNSRLRANSKEPVSLFIGDIDRNGSLDPILTYYNQGVRYPFVSRDQLVKQVPSLKKKFLKYENYKNVKLEDILSPEDLTSFIEKDVYIFSSVYIQNQGNGKFSIIDLPAEAQLFPIFSFCVDDINKDGHADILAAGNLFATQPDFGRYDAGLGLVLMGDGKGSFSAISPSESGLLVTGEGRDVGILYTSKREKVYLFSRNHGSVKAFKIR